MYTENVKTVTLLLGSMVLMSVILMLASPGCEEVLDTCASCGSISGGGASELGDPRLDDTIRATEKIVFRVHQISSSHEDAIKELAEAFDVPLGDRDLEGSILDSISQFLQSDSISTYVAEWRHPECFVGWKEAVSVQQNCEQTLCKLQQLNETALCNGYFEGRCGIGSKGSCFTKSSSSSGRCEGRCVGACDALTGQPCPGICIGTCNDQCSAYDPSGDCHGHCTGNCAGICGADAPVDCGSNCDGLCEVEMGDGGCPDPDTFWGQCGEAVESGRCRGHLFPAGYNDQSTSCDEEQIVGDCRETAKFSAWSAMTCSPASLKLTLFFREGAVDIAALTFRARTLERVLSQIATDHAWLALLVDGEDSAGKLESEDLDIDKESSLLDDSDDKYNQYFGSPEGKGKEKRYAVDLKRSYLPLENLKARFTWLREISVDSEKGYRVFAGAFPCLEPLLDESIEMLQMMIPVKDADPSDGIEYEADRSCHNASSEDPVPCLYALLESQSSFLRQLSNE